MKKLKVKWINVIKLLVFCFCIGNILRDIYLLTIYSLVIGKLYSFTWLGFITFILFCAIAEILYQDFEEQTKSTPTSRQTFRKGTNK